MLFKEGRAQILAGNFKMNLGLSEIRQYSEVLGSLLREADMTLAAPNSNRVSCIVCTQAPLLSFAKDCFTPLGVSVGAQNAGLTGSTAQTGETSPALLKELGIHYVILGHSERRVKFHETDAEIQDRVMSAQSQILTPIFCLGETLAEREAGQTEAVLTKQLISGLPKNWSEKPLVLAYEPVWAIGTGKTASPEQAQSAHAFIRSELKRLYGAKAAQTSILYGGSVTPENFESLYAQPDIDGGLVGGASLKPESFFQLIKKGSWKN